VHRWRAVIGFVCVLLLCECVIRWFAPVWQRYEPDEYLTRVQRCADQPRDIVFVGGSTVAEGINPARVGAIPWGHATLSDGFNIGLSGGTTTDIYFGTRHACPTPPQVLVYGITASDLNDNRHEPHGAQVLLNWPDVTDWQQRRPDTATWVTRQYAKGRLHETWAAYRYRYGIKLWCAEQCAALCPQTAAVAMSQRQRHADLTSGNGYVPTPWFADRQYDHMKASGWVQPEFAYLANYQLGSHLRYLDALLHWAREHGTVVVLVDMPTTQDLEARHAEEFRRYRECLAKVQARHGVVVLRATRLATGLSDAHFADLIHLNRAGCDRLSDWLAVQLTNLGGVSQQAVRRGSTP
jgi:hypothetical protein